MTLSKLYIMTTQDIRDARRSSEETRRCPIERCLARHGVSATANRHVLLHNPDGVESPLRLETDEAAQEFMDEFDNENYVQATPFRITFFSQPARGGVLEMDSKSMFPRGAG